MTRKRVRMELITHEATRLATFKKRKASVFKKANELSILCGVPVCVVVSDGSYSATTEIWPRSEEATQIISRFDSLTQSEKNKKMVDKDGFIAQQIAKKRIQLDKINRENRELEDELHLRNVMLGKCSLADLQDRELVARLQAKLEKQITEIQKRKQAPVNTALQSDLTIGTSSIERSVPGPLLCAEPHIEGEKNFPPLVDKSKSGERDLSFDVASFPLWNLLGDEEIPDLGEKLNGVTVPSLPDWSIVEKDISEFCESSSANVVPLHPSESSQSEKHNQISQSSGALTSLPEWWDEEVFRDDVDVASLRNSETVNQLEKKDNTSESSSALVSLPDWWDEEGLSDDVAPLLTGSDEEIMGMLSYYGSDQDIMDSYLSVPPFSC